MTVDGRTRGVVLVTVDSLRADALRAMPRVRELAVFLLIIVLH